MKVLSLFDGISCGAEAMRRAGIKIDEYYSSEIDQGAIEISASNWPKIIQIGDVTKVDFSNFKDVDIIIGGSPCQGFSTAGKRLEFKDERSALIKYFFKAVETIKPKHFFLENVKMRKECMWYVNKCLGLNCLQVESSVFSACRRHRMYWTTLDFDWTDSESKSLVEILEEHVDESYYLSDERIHKCFYEREGRLYSYGMFAGELEVRHGDGVILSRTHQTYMPVVRNKSHAIRAANPDDIGVALLEHGKWRIRKFTVREMERMMGLPEDYTLWAKSERKAKSYIGNGWDVNVVERFFRGLKHEDS